MDEQKELRMDNHELKQKLETLQIRLIDVNDYERWNHQDIVCWIMSLENGRFKKYEQMLIKSLEEEEMNGTYLSRVDVADVKSWGIKNFDDKKDLIQYIQKLVIQNRKKHHIDVAAIDIEGAESGGHFK